MILTALLKTNAVQCPNKPALIMKLGYRTITLTYQDVLTYAQGVAALLAHHGLKKGDAVLIYAPNSPYWGCVFWGTILKGCRIVPITTQSSKEIIERIALQTEAKIIFTSITHPLDTHMVRHAHHERTKQTDTNKHNQPLVLSPSKDTSVGLANITNYTIEELPDIVASYHYETSMEAETTPDDIIEILYTSGTTGTPKGVMLSHKNLYSNVMATKQVIPLKEGGERALSILPLSHIFEQTVGFLVPFAVKATIVYAHSPSAIRDLACQYKITKIIAVPEFLKILMSKIELAVEQQGKQHSFNCALSIAKRIKSTFIRRLLFRSIHQSLGGKLTLIACGGAPLDPELEQQWALLGMTILEGYGLSETSPIICVNTPTH
ncbi:MAG: AMP-binding protein, partial [Candidatus Babeliales bacterium]